jgi:DNA-binding NtrC family response regulator
MREIFELVRRAAPTDDNVLITGERGTGKEALAHLLHRQSRRAAAAFLRIDLGAADAATVESELFGHRKSAFAKELGGRMGRLRAASGGTLFVRDVGRLTAPLQVKLLGALERQAAAPLGADRAALLDVRLVCATQRPLAELVRSGAFRRDLLYRVDSVEIRVPSLRERIEDIAPLIEHFVEVHARELGMPPKRLARGALARLEAYAWPGNVRELRAAVERALLASSGATLAARDLLPEREPPQRRQRAIELDHYDLESVENRVIRAALDKHDGNVSRAARELGITRTSLYRRMERYGLAGRRTARPSR